MILFGDQDVAYAVHGVHEVKNALIGNRLDNPSISPEPPTGLKNAERPRRANANPVLVKFSDEERKVYNGMVTNKSSYKKSMRETHHVNESDAPKLISPLGMIH